MKKNYKQFRAAIAVMGALQVVLLGFAAVSPQLHELLYHGHEVPENSCRTDHGNCAEKPSSESSLPDPVDKDGLHHEFSCAVDFFAHGVPENPEIEWAHERTLSFEVSFSQNDIKWCGRSAKVILPIRGPPHYS